MIAALLLVVLAGQPSPSEPEPVAPPADAPAETATIEEAEAKADAAFAAADYERAAELYGQLHDRRPDPGYLYSRAQAQRLNGDDVEAFDSYTRFIEDAESLLPSVDPEDRAQLSLMVLNARKQARECFERIEPETNPQPQPTTVVIEQPEPQPTPPAAAPVEDRPPPVDWRRDPAAISLLSVGAVSTLAGASMLIAADIIDRRADDQATHENFREDVRRAQAIQRIAPAPLAIGGALVLGGIVRYLVVRRRGQRRLSTTVVAGPRSAGATLSLRF